MLLSFIVPIYNSEKWLHACLQSLVEQDLAIEEYEIICIDDGSTDGSADIVAEYRKQYGNIKLVQKTNGGVSAARNTGLDYACGRYIWFVDSDDLIRKNCLGFLKKILVEHDPEVVSFPMETVSEAYVPNPQEQVEFEYSVDARLKSYNNVWASIICTELIKAHNIRFHTGMKYGEDTLFHYNVYMYRKGEKPTLTVSNSLYYYRQQNASAMHHKTAGAYDKHIQDLLTMARIYQRDYNDQIADDPKKMSEVKMRQHMAVEGALALLPKSRYDCDEMLKKLTEEGLYPYPLMWWKVKKARGMKTKAISFVRMFFAVKFFYKIYFALFKGK